MRKDIAVKNFYRKDGEKVNISATAKQYGCSWLTIDKRVHPEKYVKERKKRIYTTILDEYKMLIDKKLESENIPATGIYDLLKFNYDYKGSYETVKNYVSKKKRNIETDLTIRFETIVGYQSQVDWKESMTLHNKYGIEFHFNIFLITLGYSRFKYIKLTPDRTQVTLFDSMISAFEYLGGTTEEIIFDNMKTVVDQAKSDFRKVVINAKFKAFSNDALFTIFTCRPYRPRTKGKVETLAKIMNRLKAFDCEFETWDDLDNIVNKLLYELNYIEKSQATNEIPAKRFEKEKEHLIPVNIDLLRTHIQNEKTYKVTHESMITYLGKKYSVPTYYVGKSLSIKEDDEFINIYYNTDFICKYDKLKSKRFNYKKSDYIDILQSTVYKDKTVDDIERITINNLNSLENINIEESE